jgi:ATPase subunit of ABC transporter with duplicated ATPase domains
MARSVSLHQISYALPGDDDLFSDVSHTFSDTQKIAIVGDNGVGKTTLLRLIAGDLCPTSGKIVRAADLYLMPQIIAQNNNSGGERQRAALEAAFASAADILILDEPTNNLDAAARGDFFAQFKHYPNGIIVVSHDRKLLGRVDAILELSRSGLRLYGGNYDFYVAARERERQSLENKLTDAVKEIDRLTKTKILADKTRDTHVKKQAKDKKNSAKGAPIVANARKGKSDETAARKKRVINEKLDRHTQTARDLSVQLRDDRIKIPIPGRPFVRNELIRIEHMTFGYDAPLFQNFDLLIRGGERIRLTGGNGAGKTTLVKLMTGTLNPASGSVKRMGDMIYLDQDLSILAPEKSVVDNIMDSAGLTKHDAHAIAANFGFRNRTAAKHVSVLSGGELLRATLATVLGTSRQPDLLILDEPTNNLDMKSVAVLEEALNQYTGALILISHDDIFIKNVKIGREIIL